MLGWSTWNFRISKTKGRLWKGPSNWREVIIAQYGSKWGLSPLSGFVKGILGCHRIGGKLSFFLRQ